MQEINFSNLWSLKLVLDENDREEHIADDEETLKNLAAQFAMWVPKLTSIEIEGGNDADDSFLSAINVICMARQYEELEK